MKTKKFLIALLISMFLWIPASYADNPFYAYDYGEDVSDSAHDGYMGNLLTNDGVLIGTPIITGSDSPGNIAEDNANVTLFFLGNF